MVLLLALAILAKVNSSSAAWSYAIAGTVSYEVQRPQGQSVPHVRSFQLVFDDCRWKITVEDAESKIIDHYVCQYDNNGDLLCYVKPLSMTNTVSGSIEHCEVPPIWISCAAEYVWLALASSCYFERATNGSAIALEPLQSPSGQYLRFDVPVEVELSKAEPHLPIRVRYVTDRVRLLGDNGTVQETALPTVLGGGYTGAEFSAGSFTNVSGLSFQ